MIHGKTGYYVMSWELRCAYEFTIERYSKLVILPFAHYFVYSTMGVRSVRAWPGRCSSTLS